MSVKIKTLQVIYEDGRQATYPIIPAAIVAAEGYAASRGMAMSEMAVEGTLYAAWTVARRKEPETPEFNNWLDSLLAAEETEEGQGVTFRGDDPNGSDSDPLPSDGEQPYRVARRATTNSL